MAQDGGTACGSCERIKKDRKRRETDATIWAIQWTIITTIVCIILAQNTAEAAKVTITKTTDQLSNFQYKGTALNGLILGHIIIKIDLKKLEIRRDELMKMQ